jgi:hypothetical protein
MGLSLGDESNLEPLAQNFRWHREFESPSLRQVLIDPAIKKTFTRDDFHVSDYSPWEGWQVEGWPTTTILRGRPIVEDGKLLGNLGDGRLVPRKIDPVVLRRPAS